MDIIEQSNLSTLELLLNRLNTKRDNPPPFNADPNNPLKHVYQNQGYMTAIDEEIQATENLINSIENK